MPCSGMPEGSIAALAIVGAVTESGASAPGSARHIMAFSKAPTGPGHSVRARAIFTYEKCSSARHSLAESIFSIQFLRKDQSAGRGRSRRRRPASTSETVTRL